MDEYSEDFESYKSTEDDKQSVRSVSRADGILICIFTMQEEGLISRGSFDLLMDYYQSDDRIGAAYDSYMESGSLEDFADTCKRVVEIVENEREEAALLAEREQQQISDEKNEAAMLAEQVAASSEKASMKNTSAPLYQRVTGTYVRSWSPHAS